MNVSFPMLKLLLSFQRALRPEFWTVFGTRHSKIPTTSAVPPAKRNSNPDYRLIHPLNFITLLQPSWTPCTAQAPTNDLTSPAKPRRSNPVHAACRVHGPKVSEKHTRRNPIIMKFRVCGNTGLWPGTPRTPRKFPANSPCIGSAPRDARTSPGFGPKLGKTGGSASASLS